MLHVTREHVQQAHACCETAKEYAKGRTNSLQYMNFGDTRVIAFPGKPPEPYHYQIGPTISIIDG